MSTYTANIEAMNQVVGYDVVIVCTSTEAQAAYWQERLALNTYTFTVLTVQYLGKAKGMALTTHHMADGATSTL